MGYAVVQLVAALRYKLEGHRLGFECGHWNFSLTVSFWPHYGPGANQSVTEMSKGKVLPLQA